MMSRTFWNKYLRAYDALNRLGDYSRSMEEIARRLCDRPGLLVLDAGSGTGNLSLAMRARAARVVSLDFSGVALQIHREKDRGACLLQASLEQTLPLRDAVFDRVACTSVLFTLSAAGREGALREFSRVLKPGGRMVVTAMQPRRSKLAVFMRLLRRELERGRRRLGASLREVVWPMLRVLYYNYLMYGLALEGHYARLGRGELEQAVARAGFGSLSYRLTYGGRFHLVEASR